MIIPLCRKMLLPFFIFCFLFGGISHGASAGKSWKLSSTQRKFVKAYGNPELFMLVFDRPQGKGATARRIESWIYLAHSKFVIFDNGFFSEEQPADASLQGLSQVPATPLRPAKFHAAMAQNDITRIFGKPDNIETAKFGRHTFRTLRYLKTERRTGILNVTFYDNRIAGVVAGFALQPADIEKLGRDLERGMP